MLTRCISGVIVHRKIFADFFTFRPEKKPRRLALALHNVTGVLGLPFHFVITLSRPDHLLLDLFPDRTRHRL